MLLATEPLWAALFAGLFIGEALGPNDALGGALLVGACLANALKPDDLRSVLGMGEAAGGEQGQERPAEAAAAAAAGSAPLVAEPGSD